MAAAQTSGEPIASRPESAKQKVALYSLLAAIVLLTLKLAVGLHVHSLGILAEAAHSGLDLIATLLTWVSIRLAARPADANHPFGHGKYENFSAFLQTGLLVFTALAIGGAAIERAASHSATVTPDIWAFGVIVGAMVIDWYRSSSLRRAAKKYMSDALEADALNFTSDLGSNLAVLVGLAAVLLGRALNIGWLVYGDAAAAIIVAAAMLWVAVRLGRRTAGVLLDEVPSGLVRDLRSSLQGIEGVQRLDRLRMRRVGSKYFVDLQLALEKESTIERARVIQEEVKGRIHSRLPEADVVVEAQARPKVPVNALEQVQAIAQRNNLTIHDLSIYDVGAGLDVEFHLELDESMSLAAAHNRVSRLETEMRGEMPAIRQILTHIEPESERVSAANLVNQQRIATEVKSIASRVKEVLDCHDIQVRQSKGHLTLSFHCSFPDQMPVGSVHEVVSKMETDIKKELPELVRVTIHPEPGSDNQR